MKVVAVCACTVGIAHTYMAQEAIEQGFKNRGIDIKVETQGGLGIDNELSDEEIADADAALLAIDVGIEGDERFNDKRDEGKLLQVGTADAISDIDKVVDQLLTTIGLDPASFPKIATAEGDEAAPATEALKAEAKPAEKPAEAAPAKAPEAPKAAAATAGPHGPQAKSSKGLFSNFGKDLLKAFNTGVSYFIPVVVIGGVFLAFSLASGKAGANGMEITNPFMANLNLIGSAGIAMMIPVLAAYIAYSLAGKPALAPGFVLGYLVNNPVTVGKTQVSTGFLGAMIMAVCVGYFVRWMKTWKVNNTIQTIMPILIIPILTSLVLGLLYIYVLATPLGAVMNWLNAVLGSLQGGSAIVLGIVIGIMTAFDMGGPVNKTASTFTMALMTMQPAVYGPNGMFRVAVAVPPIACGIASLIAKNKFDDADRQMGISAIFMGCIGITEGAIPFAVKDFIHTVPALCAGSAVGAALAAAQGIECYVPHGGFIVCLATNNIGLYCLDIVIGSIVGAALLIAMRPKLAQK